MSKNGMSCRMRWMCCGMEITGEPAKNSNSLASLVVKFGGSNKLRVCGGIAFISSDDLEE